MTISQVSSKMDMRLNKGASADNDNLWSYHKQDAFNKAVTDWVRRTKRGKNQTREGDESTDTRVDDLQVLLKKETMTVRDRGIYIETGRVPADYLYYKRLTPVVSKGICTGVIIKSHLKEEANVDELISTCSFDFEETFHTLIGNRANVYHNKDFKVERVELTYYRNPKFYNFKKLSDIIEFKNDVCEILVDEACKILSSDIESFNQKTLAQERGDTDS